MSLLHINARLSEPVAHDAILTMAYETRQRSRFRTELDNGEAVALFLPPGRPMRAGDLLGATDGRVIQVRAALEPVSTGASKDPAVLIRTAYHLGNRHVLLQLGEGWLRYLRDDVLDEMIKGLGLSVHHELAAFDPEPGAYHNKVAQGEPHD